MLLLLLSFFNVLITLTIYTITYLLTYGDRMNTINETFTENEFEEIKSIKKKTGLNWHDFILRASHTLNACGD